MAEVVLDENEISLNAVRYPLAKPVQSVLASLYPEKLVTGDYSKESQRDLSVLALSDHRGGIGLDVMEGQGDTDRSWYSTCDTRYKGHLILPPLVTNTGSLPAGITGTRLLMAYKGAVYADIIATSTGIYKYASGSWGSRLFETGAAYRDSGWTLADLAGVSYLAFGDYSGVATYIYYNGTNWTAATLVVSDCKMAFWDDRLWGLDLTTPYRFFYTFTPGSAEVVLRIPPVTIPLTRVGRLFVGRVSSGETTLYLALPTGLYVYDVDNDKWYPTGLQLPDNSGAGGASGVNFAVGVSWRDDIYFATRSSIFRYSVRAGEATVTPIGPDLDGGLPSTKGYLIADMVGSLNDLIVSVYGGIGFAGGAAKTSLILAWNGRAWRVLYEGGAGLAERLDPLLVAGIAGDYQLWWANTTTSPFNISYLSLPADLVNPLQIPTLTYAAAGTHDWPWFTAGQSEVTKVAVRLKVETLNPTTAETVKVYYAINRSTTFQIMTNSTYTNGTITAAGVHTFDFPSVDTWVSTTAKVGTAFRSIQFRVVFARGSTNTNTPDVLSLTLEYYKKLDAKWGHQVDIDLTKEYKGNTPKQLRAALLTAVESSTLVEFTFRDPNANSNATFYVQARAVTGLEQTGLDERGAAQVQLVEV